ncbi:ABC transporter ATP-binding protein [Bacillus canaveralius]|uniref:ABC transporter ATP-binding protein n=1 Tax=Bacillus canaveralius TaxID=1403243 RepID=A0A2N5GKL4_9BACI|nr:ABC transporter ATP-binding protein [Bacillus canaveralius]PLR81998.1 ABC transporter ATP-binding protein [Bacillus canaveralius]PLR99384.1 ABC transporter ATP-binding protein [Bacillus canaveralius]
MSIISLKDIQVVYNSFHPVYALQDVSLSIEKGEWITILGPSGSGKTILLNVIGGMERSSMGEVEVAGMLLNGLSDDALQDFRRNKIGFIFQHYRLLDQYTVVENVMLPQWPYLPKKEIERRATEILSQLHMSHRLEHLPGELSGGEKQRTAIARAMVHNPEILCDEPTGNLDGENRDNILTCLEDLHYNGMTILIVTHDEEVAKYGDRSLFLRDGILKERVGFV